MLDHMRRDGSKFRGSSERPIEPVIAGGGWVVLAIVVGIIILLRLFA